ncbi:dihydrodipicolinate synthase family protein [Leucobacter musarum]|uniref:dihydrodipicolinate synthase family protein n=1 Tax=Leucobacter musarum TaxID=1930747 RepID=UPI0006A7C0F6|nr:dihydrodipicolinate synthase family protein [Leucobacter musarum]
MITGLSAFPLTPLHDDRIDKPSFTNLIRRLAAARVDSITVLGSTGSYAYLTAEERAIAVRIAVENAGSIPVFVGVGALRTSHVLDHIERAEAAGASGLLLAPMSYQPLTEDDVYELFRTVSTHTELPVIVYDNPGTTHFQFSHELYARLAKLPGVASIKIPGVPTAPEEARALIAQIRAEVPEHISIGVSGDRFAAQGFAAGCDAWYSVIGGTLPEAALSISRPAADGDFAAAQLASDALEPLWNAFAEFGGSYRVTAAIAEHLGLAQQNSLPLPIQGLTRAQRAEVAALIDTLDLTK